jgi:hypothetical protein
MHQGLVFLRCESGWDTGVATRWNATCGRPGLAPMLNKMKNMCKLVTTP